MPNDDTNTSAGTAAGTPVASSGDLSVPMSGEVGSPMGPDVGTPDTIGVGTPEVAGSGLGPGNVPKPDAATPPDEAGLRGGPRESGPQIQLPDPPEDGAGSR